MTSTLLQKILRTGIQLKKRFEDRKAVLDSETEGFADYAVKVHQGTTGQLIVAFSGVGNVSTGEVHFEWGHSLISACEGAHILFIKDNSRQWYTRKAGQTAVIEYLQDYIKQNNIQHTLALGLSMGGYGALVFSSLMQFDRVVVMASRACAGKASDFDTRNRTLMRDIPATDLSEVTGDWFNTKSRYLFIASRDQVNDLKHLALLKKSCPRGDFYLTRGDHNLGHEMNLRGAMKPFLQWLASSDTSAPPLGIDPARPELFMLAHYLLEKNLQSFGAEQLRQFFPTLTVNDLPIFLLPAWVQSQLTEKKCITSYPCPCFSSVTAGALRAYLGMGWYAPDDRGVWSQGWWHQLKGEVASSIKDRQFKLHLHLEFYFPPTDEPLVLGVSHAGEQIQAFKLDRKVKKRYLQLPLPTDEQGCFDLWLHTPFASMPALNNGGEDCREIAIYLKSFVITHA